MNDAATQEENSPPQGFFSRIGFLRVLFALSVAVCAPMALYAQEEPLGWLVFPVYVAPVLVILLFWGLLFDMLMSRVFMSDKQGEARAPHRTVLWLDATLIVVLLLSWLPFFYSLVAG